MRSLSPARINQCALLASFSVARARRMPPAALRQANTAVARHCDPLNPKSDLLAAGACRWHLGGIEPARRGRLPQAAGQAETV